MPLRKLSPHYKISGTDLTVGDFWSWAYSDIVCNTTRPIFAEFLVGYALGATKLPRIAWDHVDLYYRDKKIEVKSSAFIQRWRQEKLWNVDFDIGKKKPWYARTNTWGAEAIRSADCYVFSVYPDKDLTKLNDSEIVNREMLDVSKWQFLVLPTDEIENDPRLNKQGKISLSPLEKKCKAFSDKCGFESYYVDYQGLKPRIDAVLFDE
jgi:hypothetical protein